MSEAPLGLEEFRAVWARWDACSPRQQAAAFAEAVPRLHDTLDALDNAERRRLRPWFHTGHVELSVFLAFRLVEQALHAWDVHVAFEPTTPVDAQAVGLLVELLPLGASLVDARLLGALAPARLAIETSDPARRYVLDLGEQARLGPAEAGEVSGSLRLPAEALVRLLTGRLDPAHTPASTRTEGRPSLDELRQLYSGEPGMEGSSRALIRLDLPRLNSPTTATSSTSASRRPAASAACSAASATPSRPAASWRLQP
jgi:hypothetical protein